MANRISYWRFLLILLLTICGVEKGFSQEASHPKIMITGMALNAADGSPVPLVNIIDLRTHHGTVGTIDGSFTFTVLVGDTVKFSSIGFQDVYLIADSTVPRESFKVFT